MPRLLLVLLVLNGLFLALAIWGAVSATPGEGGIGAGLAGMAAIVTAVPLAIALLLALWGRPRIATAAALLPFLVVAGYQYLGVVAEREYDRTLHGADDFTDPGAQKLAAAIADGNEALLRELAASGADLNARGPNGDTILTFAIMYWPERVPLIVELGADPNLGAGPASGPLYRAAVTGAAGAVDALLRAGAKPDVTDGDGTPVIFHTLKLQDPAIFDMFVSHGADLRGRDDRGDTLLMAAAYHRHWPQARMLLERGIDPVAQNRYGDTLESLLEQSHMDEPDLADPDYRALIAALADRGVHVVRRAS
jgi:ankyrin repeat protein